MAYTIVKEITVTGQDVILNSAPSNVLPHEYTTEKDRELSEILRNKGRDELDKAILLYYWQGALHSIYNQYVRAVDSFREKHPEITWMNTGVRIGERHGRHILYENAYVADMLLGIYKEQTHKK